MKKTATAAATVLVLAAALASSAASAQGRPHGDRDHDGVPNAYDRHDGRGHRDRDHDGVPNRFDRHDNRRYWARNRYHGPRWVAPRNYRHVQYRVGTYLPAGYYGPQYYVDYRPYGLAVPPPGYRWARVGSDVYLVSTRNGMIRDVLYSLFY